MGENHQTKFGQVRTRSEQSAKDFSLKETKFLKRKSVDTFYANKSRQPLRPHTFFFTKKKKVCKKEKKTRDYFLKTPQDALFVTILCSTKKSMQKISARAIFI